MRTNTNMIPIDFDKREAIKTPVEKSTKLFGDKISEVIEEGKNKEIVALSTKKLGEKLVENVRVSELIKDMEHENNEINLGKFFNLSAYKINQIHEEHANYQKLQLAA